MISDDISLVERKTTENVLEISVGKLRHDDDADIYPPTIPSGFLPSFKEPAPTAIIYCAPVHFSRVKSLRARISLYVSLFRSCVGVLALSRNPVASSSSSAAIRLSRYSFTRSSQYRTSCSKSSIVQLLPETLLSCVSILSCLWANKHTGTSPWQGLRGRRDTFRSHSLNRRRCALVEPQTGHFFILKTARGLVGDMHPDLLADKFVKIESGDSLYSSSSAILEGGSGYWRIRRYQHKTGHGSFMWLKSCQKRNRLDPV